MRTTFIQTLTELAEHDPNIWLLCGDLGFSVLEEFARRHPGRFINAGVAEQNLAGMAAGIALSGKTVFIYSIGNFPTLRCLEQLRNDVCYHGANVKVVAVGAGFAYGSQGYTHHAIEDVAILSTLPGMEVFVPCDPTEVRSATQAIVASGKPSYLRLSRAGEPVLRRDDIADIRKPGVLRDGSDVTLVASGPIASICLEAADLLTNHSIAAQVVSVPCLKPFDAKALTAFIRKGGPIVTVEEHILRGGLFANIAACIASGTMHGPVRGFGIPEPVGKISVGGSREALLKEAGLSPQSLVDGVLALVRGS